MKRFDYCSLLQVVVLFFLHQSTEIAQFVLVYVAGMNLLATCQLCLDDGPTDNLPWHLLPAVSATRRERGEIRIAAFILRTWLLDILLWTEDCVHSVLIGKFTNGVFTNSQTEVEIPEMSRKLQPFIIHRTDHQLHTICELAQDINAPVDWPAHFLFALSLCLPWTSSLFLIIKFIHHSKLICRFVEAH